jgi:hypothetical protein
MYLWPDGKKKKNEKSILIDHFTYITIDYNDESLDTLSFSVFFPNFDVKKKKVMYVYISQENIKKNGGGTRSVNMYAELID